MKTFHCDKCNQQVFFENTFCFSCNSTLGYVPEQKTISAFEPNADGTWGSLNAAIAGAVFKKCRNYAQQSVCNWMLNANDTEDLCASCQLTEVIPNLTSDKNQLLWQRLESAKRRLLYSLWSLQLEPISKKQDQENGLQFLFLEDGAGTEKVMTGHDNGVITINIEEADAVERERHRDQMGEPYRTLLGHFRHESGHYYFDRLIANTNWLAPFRNLFGDERSDYSESLKRHYAEGARSDWEQVFVSAYASSHPWEDWAETWAHYLHMIDTLETAQACGLLLAPRKTAEPQFNTDQATLQIGDFDKTMNDWFALSYVLNSLNRSVGMPDPYPFKLAPAVHQKLGFVHQVVQTHGQNQ